MKRPFAISLLAGGMLYSPFAAAQIETGNAPKDRSLDEVIVTGTRNETDAAPVSYTHLDVYKRQVQLYFRLTTQVLDYVKAAQGIIKFLLAC